MSKKYTKNEAFFDEPNILNCLVAGELATDGCIGDYTPSGNVKFSKTSDDINYLYKLKNLIEYDGKISITHESKVFDMHDQPYFYEGNKAEICINSAKRWIINLAKYWNITPRKTFTLQGANLTAIEHVLAYYLGATFGDGSYFLLTSQEEGFDRVQFKVLLYGTESFLSFFKKMFDPYINTFGKPVNVMKERPKAKIFQYGIGGAKAYIIFKMILCLGLDKYVMDRKFNKAKEFVNFVENKRLSGHFLYQLKNHINPLFLKFLEKYGEKVPEHILNYQSLTSSHIGDSKFWIDRKKANSRYKTQPKECRIYYDKAHNQYRVVKRTVKNKKTKLQNLGYFDTKEDAETMQQNYLQSLKT